MSSLAPAPVRNAPHIGRALRAADVTFGPDGSARLCGAECEACSTRIFPAAPVCPICNAERLKPLVLGSSGKLYAYSTVHVAPATWETPYVIGYVDLPEGVRVFGKVDGADGLQPDMTVQVRIEEDAAAGTSPATPAWRYWFAPA
jgi:uncharacterized OB-fold protein